LEAERVKVAEALEEFNVAWSAYFGLRLELLAWESHTYPAFGDDAQAVINAQIPDDYDIFIGLMWHRFGTRTGRAGSGTEEEFLIAKRRLDSDPSSVAIMFYFKDEPIAPSSVDPLQLQKVNQFRRGLGEEGGYYFKFRDPEQFSKLLRLHLSRQVQRILKSEAIDRTHSPSGTKLSIEEKHLLIQDAIALLHRSESESEGAISVLSRMTEATEWISSSFNRRARELSELDLVSGSSDAIDRNLEGAAADMLAYSALVSDDSVPLRGHMHRAIEATTKAVILLVPALRGGEAGQIDLRSVLAGIGAFQAEIERSIPALAGFRDAVGNMSPSIPAMAHAQVVMMSAMNRLLDDLEAARSLAQQAQMTISELS
jgi:hypothetical protein